MTVQRQANVANTNKRAIATDANFPTHTRREPRHHGGGKLPGKGEMNLRDHMKTVTSLSF